MRSFPNGHRKSYRKRTDSQSLSQVSCSRVHQRLTFPFPFVHHQFTKDMKTINRPNKNSEAERNKRSTVWTRINNKKLEVKWIELLDFFYRLHTNYGTRVHQFNSRIVELCIASLLCCVGLQDLVSGLPYGYNPRRQRASRTGPSDSCFGSLPIISSNTSYRRDKRNEKISRDTAIG